MWSVQGAKMQKLLMVFLALLTPQIAVAKSTEICRADANGQALDFWIGDWRVTDAKTGSFQGEDRVERIQHGCGVVESWKGAEAGDEGTSLFFYDAVAHRWEQIWVTPDTSRPGGLKHKVQIASYADGGTRFQGNLALPDGRIVIDRTTLTPLGDGRVHQLIELSKDGGANWAVGFDAIYAPK